MIRFCSFAAMLLLFVAGCGEGTPGDVTGKVTFNGKPLPAGTVTLIGPKGQIETALINPEGEFRLPKAPAGDNRVTVQTPYPGPLVNRDALMKSAVSPEGKELVKRDLATASIPSVTIPARYNDANQSGLKLTVKPGSQVFNIDLVP